MVGSGSGTDTKFLDRDLDSEKSFGSARIRILNITNKIGYCSQQHINGSIQKESCVYSAVQQYVKSTHLATHNQR